MHLFPVLCTACTLTFEGGNHVRCPRCEEPDDMHTALMDLKRDVAQLNSEHVAYVAAAYPAENRELPRYKSAEEKRQIRELNDRYARVTSEYAHRHKKIERRGIFGLAHHLGDAQ